MIYLIEQEAAIDAAGTRSVFRWASHPRFKTQPNENPRNTTYLPRIITPGNFERHAWARATTRGQSEVGYGAFIIDNADRTLDDLRAYGFDGFSSVIRRGPGGGTEAIGQYPLDYPTMVVGTCGKPIFDRSTISFPLRDRQGEIWSLPYQPQPNKYLGNNSLPNGVEGVATDLKGKPKPKLRGTVKNIPVPCVNTSKLIYQIDDGTALLPMTIGTVYVGGVALAVGTSRASLSAMTSNTPTAGSFDYYAGTDGWYIRLGTDPSGKPVNVDVAEGAASDRTVAQIVKRILTGTGVVSSSGINGVSKVDGFNSAEVGWWQDTSETTVGAVIDVVLDSINGFCCDDRDGVFQLGYYAAPQGPPVLTIKEWMVNPTGLAIIHSDEVGEGLPVSSVITSYCRNYAVQSATEIQSAGLVRLGFVSNEFRSVSSYDSTILLKHKLAPQLQIQTLFDLETAAQAESDRQLNLRKLETDTVSVQLDPSFTGGINLGDTVKLEIDRFNWSSRLFFVLGYEENYGRADQPSSTTLILKG